ncbi:MAG: PBP1A family penicillin-binding protein [Pseudomonadota bacterium]
MAPPARKKSGGAREGAGAAARRKGGGAARGRKGGKPSGNRWLLKTTLILLVGVLLGGGIVGGALYREAQVTVAARLEGAVWSTPGRVYGGPIEIWPGLTLDPAELAADLRAAGYAQVAKASTPGDFQLAPQAVKVVGAAARGPGWSVPAQEVLVTFRDGRVATVSPSRQVRLAPPIIATLAGPSAERRSLVPLADIPEPLQQAVLAMEDADFYRHPGLSFSGVVRALLVNLTAGHTVQGGSTLTQQLAKNLFLDPQRSLARKAREAFLALAIEEKLGKSEILELYLNGIYLGQAGGQGVYGVAEASRVFFGKPVERLTLGECATLGGIISAPNAYSPLNHPEVALERRDLALRRMSELGMIEAATLAAELERPLETHPTTLTRGAGWGVDFACEQVEADRGPGSVASQGLTVYTTLSPALQRLAERSLAAGLAEVEAAHPKAAGVQAAVVVLGAGDGRILALVGGRDYAASSFDRAVHAARQVGSVIKPVTLIRALDADPHLRLTSRLEDEPLERRVGGKVWRPTNYDGVYRGSVSLRRAIEHSYNIPAVHLAERVGLPELQRFARSLGLANATKLPSAALGAFEATPLQVAGAYTVFPGGGRVARPWLLGGVADAAGQEQALGATTRERVVSGRAAALAVRALEGVMAHGTGAGAARYGVEGAAAGKTGTTDDGRDAWFVGFTPELVVAVWVGFDRGRAHGMSGATAALPTWARIVAGSGTSGGSFRGTAGLVQVEVCAATGLPPGPDCAETYLESFAAGDAPEAGAVLEEGEGETPAEGEDAQPHAGGAARALEGAAAGAGLRGPVRALRRRDRWPRGCRWR